MSSTDEETEILDRIARNVYSAEDLDRLRHLISVRGDRNTVQVGRHNVRLNHGRNIHIGDRIYRGMNAEMIRDVLAHVVDEVGNTNEIRRGSLRGFSGLVMTLGLLTALSGFAIFFLALISQFESDFESDAIPTLPPEMIPVGFAVAAAGAIVYWLGQVIRGWERPKHMGL